MKRKFLTTLLLCCFSQVGFAYDTGAMSCDEIGQYAAMVFTERGKGQSKGDALAAVSSQTDWTGELEKRNLEDIVNIIHGKTGDQLYDSKAAHMVIKRDCDIGQRRRQN